MIDPARDVERLEPYGVPPLFQIEDLLDAQVVARPAEMLCQVGDPLVGVIERLGEATRRAVSAPEFVRRLGASGEIAAPSASPAEYAGLLKVESERWGRIIKPMRIQLD